MSKGQKQLLKEKMKCSIDGCNNSVSPEAKDGFGNQVPLCLKHYDMLKVFLWCLKHVKMQQPPPQQPKNTLIIPGIDLRKIKGN
uniref:Uncharacterized protein n=1 Tax=viral metagenome TaxID=1070528 RepID=A0A6M3L025_9ZZZZ